MIFETHAHYDDEVFNEDRGQLLAGLPEKGIGRVINVGASIETTRTTLALAEAYDYIYAAVGVHPSDIDGLNEETYSWLKAQTAHPKTVAVGEIGLDYYWDKEPEVQAAQREWFVRQLTLAGETDLPVIIHSRDAAEDTMRILKETGRFREHPGVIHCYSYSPEQAKEYVKMGYCIGVGGVVTFKNAKKLRQTVEQISLEHILLETDCPYMAPAPGNPQRFLQPLLCGCQDCGDQRRLCAGGGADDLGKCLPCIRRPVGVCPNQQKREYSGVSAQ